MKKIYIVELEHNVFISYWDGDPGRTTQKAHAKVFNTKKLAERGLKKARKYKPFKKAEIRDIHSK